MRRWTPVARGDELAFCETPEVNDSTVQVFWDDSLRTIAEELLKTVRKNATIDWPVKESFRCKSRVMVRRILRNHQFPLE